MKPPVSAPISDFRAFSVVELLVVIGILATLSIAAIPSIGALKGAGNINKATAEIATTLELARIYAMAHQSYVRIAIADVPAANELDGSTVILALNSADGTLTAASAADMADGTKWPAISRPLVLRNLEVRGDLNTSNPSTINDARPSNSDIDDFQRSVPGFGNTSFTSFVQFAPDGQAYVNTGSPARNVALGLDKRGAQGGQNPFIIRVSGNNGSVRILRKEDGVSRSSSNS